MNKAENIILFGGSFDPPHLGHMIIAQWVAEALSGVVSFLPAGNPPHKKPQGSGEHRLEMLKIATVRNPGFLVDEYEYRSGKVNYSVETLQRYHQDFGVSRDNLYFVLGSDSLRDLNTWRDPQGIVSQATLVAFAREAVDWRELLLPLNNLKAKIILCKAPIIEVSSTLVRERVKQGLSVRYLVPPGVEEYIVRKGLYQEGI
ncbi:MAG TPA: nicotinate (nicotinamide) nucleotide adenylyltransferase [Firmicutes bacterium]|jgi:nicotinate-nucleotide adenylyltransferase|nr:nicotinate (nicotinamide) nucleotide adenylyltransferase [Bacillota bacterium]HCX78347.1 nicotinate (nicotinamide) nucleotide adenylyltransferase [Bacillota bacterium]